LVVTKFFKSFFLFLNLYYPRIMSRLMPMTSSRATTDDGNQPMTAAQAGTLKRLAQDTYELDAFKPNLTRAEAEKRIITLTAKLKLLGEPPHTL